MAPRAMHLPCKFPQTDANGIASANLLVNPASAPVQVTVCVAPGNNSCQVFNATVVPASSLQLQAVAGTLQILAPATAFQPIIIRVTDSSVPPNPVLGAGVLFVSYVGRLGQSQTIIWAGEAGISQPSMPVIIAKSQTTVQSDINGLATVPISTQGVSGSVAVVGTATAGNSIVQFAGQQLGP